MVHLSLFDDCCTLCAGLGEFAPTIPLSNSTMVDSLEFWTCNFGFTDADILNFQPDRNSDLQLLPIMRVFDARSGFRQGGVKNARCDRGWMWTLPLLPKAARELCGNSPVRMTPQKLEMFWYYVCQYFSTSFGKIWSRAFCVKSSPLTRWYPPKIIPTTT